jgi:transposase InsO family protein
MSERAEFVVKAMQDGVNMSALCREYHISRKTGYKWLKRYQEQGRAGLEDRSRRPAGHPNQTPAVLERVILEARALHPAWGGRKLKRWLENKGWTELPAPSTITAILRRHGCLDPAEGIRHRPFTRFEMEDPNQLWQMDFKGKFPLVTGQECHPLTVLDDHSRFLIGLKACPNETHQTVSTHLTSLFRLYGLPERMLMDNGSPWGDDASMPYTIFTVWLLRLGIRVSHGRPYHPQTQGKTERFNRSLQAELLNHARFASLARCQAAFDDWRGLYNLERPHEALDLEPPASRYQPSSRLFPETLPPLQFPPGAIVRRVNQSGKISFQNRPWRVGKAFRGQAVGLLPDALEDGLLHVFFNTIHIRSLDLRT